MLTTITLIEIVYQNIFHTAYSMIVCHHLIPGTDRLSVAPSSNFLAIVGAGPALNNPLSNIDNIILFLLYCFGAEWVHAELFLYCRCPGVKFEGLLWFFVLVYI